MTVDMAAKQSAENDLTLEEMRSLLAPKVARHAAFDGWGDAAVGAAAADCGIDAGLARIAMGKSPVDHIDAWFAHVDDAMRAAMPVETLSQMGMTRRITTLIETRLDILSPEREGLRRAIAILALPTNAARAARLAWRSADSMWRQAGDTASDFNHYSKRMTLGAVYTSTIAVFLNDDSDGQAETRAFLARRIANVMQFEKWKGSMRARRIMRPSLTRFISRLRYPRH